MQHTVCTYSMDATYSMYIQYGCNIQYVHAVSTYSMDATYSMYMLYVCTYLVKLWRLVVLCASQEGARGDLFVCTPAPEWAGRIRGRTDQGVSEQGEADAAQTESSGTWGQQTVPPECEMARYTHNSVNWGMFWTSTCVWIWAEQKQQCLYDFIQSPPWPTMPTIRLLLILASSVFRKLF